MRLTSTNKHNTDKCRSQEFCGFESQRQYVDIYLFPEWAKCVDII